MGTVSQKLCCACGEDVSQRRRTKDSDGNYYCSRCWAEAVRDTRGRAESSPSATVNRPTYRPTAPVEEKRLRAGEIALIAGGVALGSLVVGLILYFGVLRDRWENQNGRILIALHTDASALAKKGQFGEAKAKYDEMFRLLGERKVRDASLYDTLRLARESSDRVAKEIAAEPDRQKARLLAAEQSERKRQEDERQQQELQRLAQQRAEDEARQQEAAKQRQARAAKAKTLYDAACQHIADDKASLAMSPLEEAAALGSADAMYQLGHLQVQGLGTIQNYDQAADWFKKAADGGNPEAMTQLGFMALNGVGTQRNTDQAARWFRKAADAGHARAMVQLGILSLGGDGKPPNISAATAWFQKAIDLGNTEAMLQMGGLRVNAGTAQGLADAARWFEKAAQAGNVRAMNAIGVAYQDGSGVVTDYPKAIAWYSKAIIAGDTTAMLFLASVYLDGKGVPRDPNEAVKLLTKSATMGNSNAMYILGKMSEDGEELKQDFVAAVDWYRRASFSRHTEASFRLGTLYYTGRGVAQDYTQAIAFFKKAGEASHAQAAYAVGAMLAQGHGETQDRNSAMRWFQRAKSLGFEQATDAMARLEEEVRQDRLARQELAAAAAQRWVSPSASSSGNSGATRTCPTCNGRGIDEYASRQQNNMRVGALASQNIGAGAVSRTTLVVVNCSACGGTGKIFVGR